MIVARQACLAHLGDQKNRNVSKVPSGNDLGPKLVQSPARLHQFGRQSAEATWPPLSGTSAGDPVS